MPRNFLSSMVLAALATFSTACDVTVKVVNSSEAADSSTGNTEQTSQDEGASSGANDSSSSRGEEETSDSSSSSSTGELDSSSTGISEPGTTGDADGSSSGSTGEPLAPKGADCAQDEECESGLCGLGECVQVAAQPCEEAPEQCGATQDCVTFAGGAACILTGADTQGGEGAVNDSPAGEIDETDLDVWEITDLPAGSYTVKLKAESAGGELFILAADGAVLADPASGIQPEDVESGFIEYTITLDAPQPAVTVVVHGIYPGNLPYYFYTVIQ